MIHVFRMIAMICNSIILLKYSCSFKLIDMCGCYILILFGFFNLFRHANKQFKRAVSSDTTVRGPYNANKHSSYVELILVVDNKIYKHMDQNMKKVHERCKDIANIINAVSQNYLKIYYTYIRVSLHKCLCHGL